MAFQSIKFGTYLIWIELACMHAPFNEIGLLCALRIITCFLCLGRQPMHRVKGHGTLGFKFPVVFVLSYTYTQGVIAWRIPLGRGRRWKRTMSSRSESPACRMQILHAPPLCRCRFKADDWGVAQEDVKNPKLWDKSWDDGSVNDPLGQQLRAELPKVLAQQAQQ